MCMQRTARSVKSLPSGVQCMLTVLEALGFYMLSHEKTYCKRGKIRGALSFANFAENSSSANSKTRENICDILYAHLGHVGVVLMQMGNILDNV